MTVWLTAIQSLRCVLLALVLTPVMTSWAQGLDITIYRPGFVSIASNAPTYTVQLSGAIDAGAPERLRERLKSIPPEFLVAFYLNSPGGSLAAGLELGRIIRSRGVSTSIGQYNGEGNKTGPGSCYSACALTFLGGPFRWIGKESEYGIHRFYTSRPTASDIETAQILSASIAAYIREMEAEPELMTLMAQTSSEKLLVLSESQLIKLGVVNNGRRPPQWSIEAVDIGLYLKGEQRTYYGHGKAIFFCDTSTGSIVYASFAPVAEDQAPSMSRGTWVHSLMVDGTVFPLPRSTGKFDGTWLVTHFVLTPAHIASISKAKSVGHAMQVARDAPTFVGYQVDILPEHRQKIQTFLNGCRRAG